MLVVCNIVQTGRRLGRFIFRKFKCEMRTRGSKFNFSRVLVQRCVANMLTANMSGPGPVAHEK